MAVAVAIMQKTAYFGDHWGDGWPSLDDIRFCLVDIKGRAAFFEQGMDGGSFFIESSEGSELALSKSVLEKAALYVHLHPFYGIKLQYSMSSNSDGRFVFHSKGNLSRLSEFVRSFHDTPLSVGLFVSFERGWLAVKEFLDAEGRLPTAIEWIIDGDLPPEAFPAP